jgi:hypothetical protein
MAFKKDLIEGLGYESYKPILDYLIEQGQIVKKDSDQFIIFIILYPRDSETKELMDAYDITDRKKLEANLKRTKELVLETQKKLFEKGKHWEQIENKLASLKFNKLSKSIYSDDACVKKIDMNLIMKKYSYKLVTIFDLLFKTKLNPKKTVSAKKENERLLRITQEIIDKIGL